MMTALREWLTSIVVVSMLLSVVQTLIPEGGIRRIASFTGGLILLLTLLQPLLGAELERLDMQDYQAEIEDRQAELEEESQRQLRALIEEETAAYISDKAAELGARVTVKVETEMGQDGIPIPCAVTIDGDRSPELTAWLEEELGISEERQK